MGRSIQDYDGQKRAPDADYLRGDLKDDTGALDGTVANSKSNSDIHQFFMKFMNLSAIIPNGLPDNEYNGYQYVDSLIYLLGNNRKVVTFSTNAASHIAEADYSTAVVIQQNAVIGHIISMDVPTGSYNAPISIYNHSPNPIDIYDLASSNNIDGAPGPYTLPALTAIDFEYDLGTTNWVITKLYRLNS